MITMSLYRKYQKKNLMGAIDEMACNISDEDAARLASDDHDQETINKIECSAEIVDKHLHINN